MSNITITQPKFIFLDAGDVLFERNTKDGDNIAKELGFDPENYDEIVMKVVSLQPKEEVEEFNHIKTLDDEYRIINRFHQRMCDYLGISYTDELITKLSEYRIKADFRLKDGVLEGVERLSKNYKLGVLSNALPSRRHFELKLGNLDRFFEIVVLSWEEGIQKPDPRLYQLAIERSGFEPTEILFTDNKVKYLEGAREAGINNLVLLKAKEQSDDFPMVNNLVELAELLGV
jgi:HAD superfamily hydrolase (TIGR01509 family)